MPHASRSPHSLLIAALPCVASAIVPSPASAAPLIPLSHLPAHSAFRTALSVLLYPPASSRKISHALPDSLPTAPAPQNCGTAQLPAALPNDPPRSPWLPPASPPASCDPTPSDETRCATTTAHSPDPPPPNNAATALASDPTAPPRIALSVAAQSLPSQPPAPPTPPAVSPPSALPAPAAPIPPTRIPCAGCHVGRLPPASHLYTSPLSSGRVSRRSRRS